MSVASTEATGAKEGAQQVRYVLPSSCVPWSRLAVRASIALHLAQLARVGHQPRPPLVETATRPWRRNHGKLLALLAQPTLACLPKISRHRNRVWSTARRALP